MKKILILIMALSLSLGLITGCGPKEDGKNKEEDKTTNELNKDKMMEEEVLSVNDEKVMKSEFNVYLLNTKMYYEAQFGGPTIWQEEGFEEKVMEEVKDNLILSKILKLKGEKNKITSKPEDETKAKENAKTIMSELPKEIIDYYGFNEKTFEKMFLEQAVNNLVYDDLMKDYKPDEAVIEESLKAIPEYNNLMEIGYANFFDKVRAKHILIKTVDDNFNPLPEEDQTKAKEQIDKLLERAKAGEDFAELARDHTQDIGSKDNGGEYTFGRGEMMPEFEKVAFDLEVGDISDVVKTPYGYHIIKLEEKIDSSAEQIQRAKDLAEDIRKSVIEIEKNKAFIKMYEEMKKDYEIKINDDVIKKSSISYTVPINPSEEESDTEDGTGEGDSEKIDMDDVPPVE